MTDCIHCAVSLCYFLCGTLRCDCGAFVVLIPLPCTAPFDMVRELVVSIEHILARITRVHAHSAEQSIAFTKSAGEIPAGKAAKDMLYRND